MRDLLAHAAAELVEKSPDQWRDVLDPFVLGTDSESEVPVNGLHQDGTGTLHVATAPCLAHVSGRYFSDCRERPAARLGVVEADDDVVVPGDDGGLALGARQPLDHQVCDVFLALRQLPLFQ